MYRYQNCEPRWINFENPNGEKGKGGIENHGAKGHAFEKFFADEVKTLCDFDGCGVIRRIWITLNERSPAILQNVRLQMYWDNADAPQVDAPLGDFFCMGLGEMRSFENRFFSTAEGRSFLCTIPMPFFKHAKILLHNGTGKQINNLFYDINLTLEELPADTMHFHAFFRDLPENKLEEDVEILNFSGSCGRFLGMNIAVLPNDELYHGLWWGEGEVKIYLDGDTDYATLVGTGAEDYVGSAWKLGEFYHRDQGCVSKIENAVSMYRFHVDDPIYFKHDIKVTVQAMGGGLVSVAKQFIEENAPYALVTYDDGDLHRIYKKDFNPDDLVRYVNFFRQDHYRTVAYYYAKSPC